MVYKDVNDTIYKLFRNEYIQQPEAKNGAEWCLSTWCRLIYNKDIGVLCDVVLSNNWGEGLCYNITDQKKWLLARLKYGI